MIWVMQGVAVGICLLLYVPLSRSLPDEHLFPKLHFEFYFYDLWPAIVFFLISAALVRTPWPRLGLAVAAGTALALLVSLLVMFRGYLHGDYGGSLKVYFGLLVVLQIGLLASAAVTYWLLGQNDQDLRVLGAVLGVPGVVLGLSAAFGPFLLKAPQRHLDAISASALESIQKLNAALRAYAASHPRAGYPPSLEELGPWRAALIDDLLATGLKRGYSFNYRAGAAEVGGHITTYTLNARPLEYWGTGLYSYFDDQTEVIHQTAKDRPANEHDPVVK